MLYQLFKSTKGKLTHVCQTSHFDKNKRMISLKCDDSIKLKYNTVNYDDDCH